LELRGDEFSDLEEVAVKSRSSPIIPLTQGALSAKPGRESSTIVWLPGLLLLLAAMA